MSELDKKREQLERAYKIASRHYQRSLADLYEASLNESKAKFALLINGGSQWECIAEKRNRKAENKRRKLEERLKQYDYIHLSSLIKLQGYMKSIGEPAV